MSIQMAGAIPQRLGPCRIARERENARLLAA